ncbi:carbohydrate ABC transporter permease [Treponema sp.]|jgi:ABC transporter, permease protein|uniref:carbohydrate ABC transporter permease n=1 Tax=Treponema sp. TaxID=166 RepID=UPI003FA1F8D3
MHSKRILWNNDRFFDITVIVLVTIILVSLFYPLYFVFIASISNPDLVSSGQVWFLPKGITNEGYTYILRDVRILRGYFNTFLYTTSGTLLALAITIPAGYALSRSDLRGKTIIMLFFVFTMYFSGGLIPKYLVVKRLKLIDTRFVLMILGSFSVFNLIITRSFYTNSLPKELQEAAEVDGCNIFQYFISVVLPLSKSIIAVIGLYYAVYHWNAFFNGLVYINNVKLYPLQLILRDILISGQTIDASITDPEMIKRLEQIARTIKYGVIIVSSLPVLLIYPFVQKHFVKGVMIGAIK